MGDNRGKSWDEKKRKEYDKEYRVKNKERRNKQSIDWHFNKAFGDLRDEVLERDNWECVMCSMTSEQHLIIFGRRITLDHIDGNRNNNTIENLQILCLRCHSSKDRRRTLSK